MSKVPEESKLDKAVTLAIRELRAASPGNWKTLTDFIRKKAEMPIVTYAADSDHIVKLCLFKQGVMQVRDILEGE